MSDNQDLVKYTSHQEGVLEVESSIKYIKLYVSMVTSYNH
jgi:hypothetical protein